MTENLPSSRVPTPSPPALPSIRARLSRWLILISAIGSLVVAATIWAVTQHEVEELMDHTLQESAEILYGLLLQHGDHLPLDASKPGALTAPAHHETLIWQLVDSRQNVLLRSHRAPDIALLAVPAVPAVPAASGMGPTNTAASAGDDPRFAEAPNGWRVIAMPFSHSVDPAAARMLYVAQDRTERREAHIEIATYTIGASLLVGLLCTLWLRTRLRRELAPLAALSEAVQHYDPLADQTRLPPATRLELAPVQRAINGLAQHLPIDGLDVATDATTRLCCDPDLLAAALLNLLDNAQRHGASQMVITCRSEAEGQVLILRDNGCGIADEQRLRLQTALDAQNYATLSGLGLMLADLVARAHDGRLTLLKEASGCAVSLTLGHGPRKLRDGV